MNVSQDLSFRRTLPLKLFEQIGQLLQQMAQAVGTEALVLTEAVLSPIPVLSQQLEQKFIVVVSQRFSALLVGNPINQPLNNPENYSVLSLEKSPQGGEPAHGAFRSPQSSALNIRLTFDPDAIALFLSELGNLLQHYPQAYKSLIAYRQLLQPNDAKLQSEFTLLLLSIFTSEPNTEPEPVEVYPYVSVCQPVEEALRQQINHERLLNQVTTQIRKSLELPVILATAVEQVREFLQLDRLVIYQFEQSGVNSQKPGDKIFNSLSSPTSPALFYSGCVVYEARASNSVPSVLNYKEQRCFFPSSECWEKYRQGFTLAIDDVDTAYPLSKCLLGFLKAVKVRAKLATPILFQEELWGLLIAHQCTDSRPWQESEKNLLRQISEQLAIAIHQAELMRSLKQEKQTLEQRVIERTQALHDALIAAQSASRAKSEFLATISHELRTPLTNVIGMSSTLLRWPLGELSQRQRHYLQTIYDSGERLLSLINDILELSQLQAGKAVLNISEFSLIALAQNSLRSLWATAQHQAVNLKLDLKFEPSLAHFTADQERVQQILCNLLSNAIKFTPAGGQVILRIWLENYTAVFQVEDTGIGIPQEQIPLLFENFQQLDTPYRRSHEGMGLGLALTKQLVELLQGRIEVESTVGVGSSFTVWLPKLNNFSTEY